MAKKSFKGGLNSLIEDSIDEINQITDKEKKEIEKINIDDISDEKIKWLYLKINRLEKELKLWRTGELNEELFRKSLKEHGLKYKPKENKFIERKQN